MLADLHKNLYNHDEYSRFIKKNDIPDDQGIYMGGIDIQPIIEVEE